MYNPAKKPNFLKIIPLAKNSLVIKTDRALETPWHFHPEVELLYCIRGRGTDFVGNNITSIEDGELLLFGKNLPHTRLGDTEYYQTNATDIPEAIVIQFQENFLGDTFFEVSELAHLKDLLTRASRGLRYSGQSRALVAAKMLEIRKLSGLISILELLSILNILASTTEYTYINPVDYVAKTHEKSSTKINQVYQYTISNFRENISLEHVASITNQSRSAFCRYFKAHTRKSYITYLTEVRIAFACELLREGNHDVTRACFASGFNNTSNFNRQFKKVMNATPKEYKRICLRELSMSA